MLETLGSKDSINRVSGPKMGLKEAQMASSGAILASPKD